MATRVLPSMVMRSGTRIPGFGFGTYLSARGEVRDAVACALDVGYRHVDTAISYGNDSEIGEVLAPLFRHDTIERKDLFLTTKVPPVYMGVEDVQRCVAEAMERLQTNYLDMLLIHVPFGQPNVGDGIYAPTDQDGKRLLKDHDFVATWKEMEKLVRRGSVRHIGLSNFGIHQIEEIMREGTLKPENLQHECHSYLQQDALREYCRRSGIVATGYSPMGAPSRPDYYMRDEHVSLLGDPVVNDVAERLGRTPGQILIRYVSQLGVIPLPKSVTPKRIVENFEAMFFDIPDDEMTKLQALNRRNMKYFTFDWAKTHPRFPAGDY